MLRAWQVEPAGAIFISGLPGGVSYFLLAMQKMGICSPIVEKRITANMNAWVRLPGILMTSFLFYQENAHTDRCARARRSPVTSL